MLNLGLLLKPYLKSKILNKIKIKKMILDSRKITKNDLFIAILGNKIDGRKFINQAIINGASAIIAESNIIDIKPYIIIKDHVPIIFLSKLSTKLSFIASNFYKYPSRNLKIIAVTGTNGKTTVVNLIAQWTKFLGEKSAIISTIGNGINNKLIKTDNTTDSAINIQKFLKYFKKKKSTLVVIEVSSHGIIQNRVSSLSFQAAIFTNLSHDHLDYHLNMKNYELSKKKLFLNYHIKHKIINADDKIGFKWLLKMPDAVAVSMKKEIKVENFKFWLKVITIIYKKSFTIITFKSSWGNATIKSYLLGIFNVKNIILSLSTLLSMNYSLNDLIKYSVFLKPIHGRMELLKKINKPFVIVDYAHTPESLKILIESSRLYCKNKIWCIFGCGGDRDQYKRPIMGKIANKYADIVIITNDNPRYEKSEKIINNILEGIKEKNNLFIIPDRKKAITYAINHANFDDMILICGKGHENYQIIGKKYFYFSDRQIASNLLNKKK